MEKFIEKKIEFKLKKNLVFKEEEEEELLYINLHF